MKEIKKIDVPQKTGSYADTLVAIGTASLVLSLSGKPDAKIAIVNAGSHYRITIFPALTEADFDRWLPETGYQYFQGKEDDLVPEGIPASQIYSYEQERARQQAYRQAQKTGTDAVGSQEIIGAGPDFAIWRTFNAMVAAKGSTSPNKLFELINNTPDIRDYLKWRFGLIADKPIDFPEKSFASAAAPLQLFNPLSGKGVHRPKPDSTGAASFPSRLVDWFDEWMKFRALNKALLTSSFGDDTKILVLIPEEIPYSACRQIYLSLQDKIQNIWGNLVFDVRVSLELAKVLVEYSEEFQGGKGTFRLRSRTPKQVIRGLHSAYFKNMGNASAIMNNAMLSTPNWFGIGDKGDAAAFLSVVQDQVDCLKWLREDNSDDIPVLLAWREFLSTGRLLDTADFFIIYGQRLMKQKADGKYGLAFKLPTVRRIFMGFDVDEIVSNPGFQNMATAIRKSTISPQFRKSITGKTPFEIRYGLAQSWKRKARFPEQLIAEIAEFVQLYNGENAKNAELKRETRKNITTTDLNQVLELIRTNGSEVVGKLLLAYGFALEPKEEESGN